MEEISTWLLESLYTMKQMYDHGCANDVLKTYGDYALDGDMMFEIACDCMERVFCDTRSYCNQSEEIETLVFFDPVITNFYLLCEEYERQTSLPSQENPYRAEMQRAISSGFSFDDYSYGHAIYTTPNGHSGCKLVLLLYPEFCSHYAVPNGLLEIRDAFVYTTERMHKELEKTEHSRVIELPVAEKPEERMVA